MVLRHIIDQATFTALAPLSEHLLLDLNRTPMQVWVKRSMDTMFEHKRMIAQPLSQWF